MIKVFLARLVGVKKDEAGFTTAELLGNAALGIVALVGIWGAMSTLGGDLITAIRTSLGL